MYISSTFNYTEVSNSGITVFLYSRLMQNNVSFDGEPPGTSDYPGRPPNNYPSETCHSHKLG